MRRTARFGASSISRCRLDRFRPMVRALLLHSLENPAANLASGHYVGSPLLTGQQRLELLQEQDKIEPLVQSLLHEPSPRAPSAKCSSVHRSSLELRSRAWRGCTTSPRRTRATDRRPGVPGVLDHGLVETDAGCDRPDHDPSGSPELPVSETAVSLSDTTLSHSRLGG